MIKAGKGGQEGRGIDDVLAVLVENLYATLRLSQPARFAPGEAGNDLEPNLSAEPAENHNKFFASSIPYVSSHYSGMTPLRAQEHKGSRGVPNSPEWSINVNIRKGKV